MSTGRIVLLGATGYTGRLTAEALVARGERPVLAARDPERLASLAKELGDVETAVADVEQSGALRAIVEPGDVVVTTIGPFARRGGPALAAAVDAGAAYIDCAAEPAFVRNVFERHAHAPLPVLTAFGWESVPGNLVAELVLRDAPDAVRVDVGYFITGNARGWMSGGTRASLTGALVEPGFVWRNGIRAERGGARVRSFDVNGVRRPSLSAASSEHFAVPRLHPHLQEVNTYLGWFGRASRPLQALSVLGAGVRHVPGIRRAMSAVSPGATGGPDSQTRARTRWHVVAVAYDGRGTELAQVQRTAGNGYDFTARILAWGAARARAGLDGTGALGPVEALGLSQLETGCAEAGLHP